MAQRRIVITGLGTVNPVAQNVPDFWSGLMEGRSGIAPITLFDASQFSSRIGGEVKDWKMPPEALGHREAKRLDRFAQFAVAAGVQAVNDSGLDFSTENPERSAVIVGSGIGGLWTLQEQSFRLFDKGPGKVSPFTVPRLMINAAGAHIAVKYDLRGVNFGVVTACASGSHAVGEAFRIMQRGEADIIITGGAEAALCDVGLASFCALRGLSTRNDDPKIGRASCRERV